MSTFITDTRAMTRYYDQACRRFSSSYKAVGWYSVQTQCARFEVASLMADWHEKSLLDVGCGQGDLLGYLHDQAIFPHYEGIDLSANMLEKARQKFPQAIFFQQDILEPGFEKQYDYCVASGPFNHRLRISQDRYIQSAITSMFRLAKLGIVFNLLSDKTPESEQDDSQFFYYSSKKIEKFCLTLSPKVEIKEGYLPNDFTVYLYK